MSGNARTRASTTRSFRPWHHDALDKTWRIIFHRHHFFSPLNVFASKPFMMVLEAGYPNTTGFRKVTKATILVKKKPGLSDEAFIEHYNHKHAQMASPILQKHNVITYSLTYCLDRDRTIMCDMLHGRAQMLDYDAICTFVFPDYKAFAKFMYDPGSKALTPDHENFMVESEMRMLVGDEYMVIEDGQKVG